MTAAQMSLDLAGTPSGRVILDRIRAESRDESEKGRWFEQLFMRIARQQPEFEIDGIWRWPDWPGREALTGLDGRDIGIDLVARRTSGEWVAIQCKCYEDRHILGKAEIDREGRMMDQAIHNKIVSFIRGAEAKLGSRSQPEYLPLCQHGRAGSRDRSGGNAQGVGRNRRADSGVNDEAQRVSEGTWTIANASARQVIEAIPPTTLATPEHCDEPEIKALQARNLLSGLSY